MVVAISRPETTSPATRSSRTTIRSTRAPVRISAPAAVAAAAMACVSRPGPPRTCRRRCPLRRRWVSRSSMHERAARRARTEHRARYAWSGDRRAQQFVLEPLSREVGDRHRQPSQQLMRATRAESAELASRFQQPPQIADSRAVDVWRWRRQHIGKQRGRTIAHRPGMSGTLCHPSDAARAARRRCGLVAPQHERITVRRQCARRRPPARGVRGHVARSSMSRDDLIVNQDFVRQRRTPEAGTDLRRDRAAADASAAPRARAASIRPWPDRTPPPRPLWPPPMIDHRASCGPIREDFHRGVSCRARP